MLNSQLHEELAALRRESAETLAEIRQLQELVRVWIRSNQEWKAETRRRWDELERSRAEHHAEVMQVLKSADEDDRWWREGQGPPW